jgi:hypothetical protein
MAADIVIPNFDPRSVCQIIVDHFPFDQLIDEFGEWTHVSYDINRMRGEKLIAEKLGDETTYRHVRDFI